MNHSTRQAIFWRLFWKEYRVQRAFWLCIALLAVLLMALPAVTIANSGDRLFWRFAIARILPALFTAACGAMLFATEHEAGTYEFQRSLPVSPVQFLLGKFAFAFCSVAALYAVCWLAAIVLSGVPLRDALASLPNWAPIGLPGRWVHVPPLASLLFALEVFLWSLLFSLLLRHPLTAAIAGAAAAAFTVTCIDFATLASVPIKYIAWPVSPQGDLRAEIPLRLAVASLLVAADVWLALRWLGERRAAPARRIFVPRSSKEAPVPFRANSAPRVVGRLVWEFWRESRGLRLALAGLVVLLAIDIADLVMRGNRGDGVAAGLIQFTVLLVTVLLAPAYFPLLGSIAFFFDQQGHAYRFLADRGVRPGHVWLARQLPVWIAATVLAAALSAFAVGWALIANVPRVDSPVLGLGAARLGSVIVNLAAAAVSLALLGVAAGQFCSMLFRNGLLAMFFGLLLSAVLALWYGLMWLYGLNWFWSVLPIPLALLLATWLRTPCWLVERNTLRAWLPTALALLLPAAALLVAVPLYRAYQIPAVSPGFSPDEYARPLTAEEQSTFELYRRAWDRQTRGNAKAIALTLEAGRSRISNAVDLRQTEYRYLPGEVLSLTRFVVLDAKRLEEQGKLDAAMEQYLAVVCISAQFRQVLSQETNFSDSDEIELEVLDRLPHWAARPHQTPQRIMAAASALDKLTSALPPDTAAVKSQYIHLRRALSGGYTSIIQSDGRTGEEALLPLTHLWSQLPWERTRALRLLDLLTRENLGELRVAQNRAEGGLAVSQPPFESRYFSGEHRSLLAKEPAFALRNEIHVPPIQGPLPYEQAERIRRYTIMVALRRGVRLSLMLEAWKLQHGSLPKSLGKLIAPGSATAAPSSALVLVDPFTGNLFRYVREGVAIPFKWEHLGTSFFSRREISANVPFVWSAGPRVIYTGLNRGETELAWYDYRIFDSWGQDTHNHYPASEYDLWEAGLPIPVP